MNIRKRESKHGEHKILVYVRHRFQFEMPTKFKFKQNEFIRDKKGNLSQNRNGALQLKSTVRHSTQINRELNRIILEIKSCLITLHNSSKEEIRHRCRCIIDNIEYIEPNSNDTKVMELGEALKIMLETKIVRDSTRRVTQSRIHIFMNFAQANNILNTDEVSKKTFVDYENYLLKKKYNNNTNRKHTKSVKGYFRWFDENYISVNQDIFKFKSTLESNDSKPITLNQYEINTLISSESKLQKLERVRHIFIWLFFTGQRISDVLAIRRDQIQDGYWVFSQQKTGTSMKIKLNEILLKILDIYSSLPFPLPIISSQKFNKYIKELFKELNLSRDVIHEYKIGSKVIKKKYKLYNIISSHGGRHTFVTNSLSNGVSISTIMHQTGHKKVSTVEAYVKPFEEAANLELSEHFDKYYGGDGIS